MSKWEKIKSDRQDGIKADITGIISDPKEVVFNLVSCMCDNRDRLIFKKTNANGYMEFRVYLKSYPSGTMQSLSNLQMKADEIDLAWKAGGNEWENVVELIETGTSVIESIMSR